ncbi:TonB-dependent receptor [Xanthomonas sp. NCPPB 2654]|uniref:TonB-dependent receptor n=1 Tax=unclassified Xanthomonas TaxID=2643310 RepID=UPI0021E0915E|nr:MULTISPECIES: TonB-dependent receptor [unclassified Xanthomonas]MDL5364637.1 TonB-dependent receptor [Xanthomonas sp. NCPPB 2654]UYC21951.1 TonB-dependent receptor [Xanthomonas sp. CFBP 8443]
MRHPYTAPSASRAGARALRSVLACAIAASLTSGMAWAQEAPAEPVAATAADAPATPASGATTLDQVQVTGIRGSIQSSINKKRDDTVISDVLSAEDIGDLPAPSLADAIETLTGAASTRDKTGASEISIRGLGAFLSSTQFNGREITNGSGDRSVNFNMFPAELINTVAIYKTQRADLIEGGVAGTIGLETVKPLDYGKRTIQIDGRGSWAEYDSKYRDKDGIGWRGTASYIDQFEFANGGKLGVSIGLQALDGTDPEESMTSGSTWYACDATQNVRNANCAEVGANAIANGAPYYLVPSSRIYRLKQERNDRQSEFAAVQWKPNDLLEVNVDYEHTDRNWHENRSDLSLSNTRRGIVNRDVDANGVLRSYSGNTSIDSTSTRYDRNEEYTGGGLNIILRPSVAWEIATDLSYSHTVRQDTQRMTRLRANARDVNNAVVPGISSGATGYVNYDWDNIGDVPSIALDPAFDVNDWDAYTGAARVTSEEEKNDHRIRAGRFDVSYLPEDGLLTKITFGLRASQADYSYFDNTITTDIAASGAGRTQIIAANRACRAPFPQDDFLDDASGNTISSWAYFDPSCLYEAFRGSSDTGVDPNYRDPNNVDVVEKTKALFLMADFRSELFGLPVSGNMGVRWVKTDVRSEGVRADLDLIDNGAGTLRLQPTGTYQTLVAKAGNDKLLPSANASFELRDNLLLRLAGYRAMSRPDIAALGSGRNVNLTGTENFTSLEEALAGITATGNPETKPLMSWNGDVSLEWYPNEDSMLAGAVYWKQFNGGTETALFDETFVVDGRSATVSVPRQVTTDKKSTLTGFELSAAHRFSYLPKPLDGLGFKLSYNYADTDYETQDPRLGEQVDAVTGTVIPAIVGPAGLSGFSRHVLSGSLYWELGRFDMQAIGKYRSKYYQDFTGNTAQQNRYYDDNTSVDFRARYRVSKNLSLSLELMNLTNEPRVASQPVYGNFREYVSYGRRAYFGVRYKF